MDIYSHKLQGTALHITILFIYVCLYIFIICISVTLHSCLEIIPLSVTKKAKITKKQRVCHCNSGIVCSRRQPLITGVHQSEQPKALLPFPSLLYDLSCLGHSFAGMAPNMDSLSERAIVVEK